MLFYFINLDQLTLIGIYKGVKELHFQFQEIWCLFLPFLYDD